MTKPNTQGVLLKVREALEDSLSGYKYAKANNISGLGFDRCINKCEQALADLDALIEAVPKHPAGLDMCLRAKEAELTNSVYMGGQHRMPPAGEQYIYHTAKLLYDAVNK